MELVIISVLILASVVLFAYEFSIKKLIEEVHLPTEIKGRPLSVIFQFKILLGNLGRFLDRLTEKSPIPLEGLKKRILAAGKPMNTSEFVALKLLATITLPLAVFIMFKINPIWLILFFGIGFILPDLWLNNIIKKRRISVLKDLPHIIDLLNICVTSGLDFMIAVNRVTQEFRPCLLTKELQIMLGETNMGSSRRDALKSLTLRVDSPEMLSFVRTLLQADRMGTPIGQVLKMQSEEIRIRRFQKGEEMALKAPIKLLLPLLVFILPVVLIIVGGPIIIQFTRGGLLKF